MSVSGFYIISIFGQSSSAIAGALEKPVLITSTGRVGVVADST